MASFNCGQCGSQDLEYKSGTSKKNGKPWQAWRCAPCNIMYGMDGKPWGQKGAVKSFVPFNSVHPKGVTTSTVPPKEVSGLKLGESGVTLETLDKKLDLIIRALELSGQGFPE